MLKFWVLNKIYSFKQWIRSLKLVARVRLSCKYEFLKYIYKTTNNGKLVTIFAKMQFQRLAWLSTLLFIYVTISFLKIASSLQHVILFRNRFLERHNIFPKYVYALVPLISFVFKQLLFFLIASLLLGIHYLLLFCILLSNELIITCELLCVCRRPRT